MLGKSLIQWGKWNNSIKLGSLSLLQNCVPALFYSVLEPWLWDFPPPFILGMRGPSKCVIILAHVSRVAWSIQPVASHVCLAVNLEEGHCSDWYRFVWYCFTACAKKGGVCPLVAIGYQKRVMFSLNASRWPCLVNSLILAPQNWRDPWPSPRSEWCVSRPWRLWSTSTRGRSSTETWKLETSSCL